MRQVRLVTRTLIASAVLAALVGSAFVVLVVAVASLREANDRASRAKDVTVATLALEKLVIDLETGLRGLILARNERFLDPWRRARRELPARRAALRELARDPRERRQARALERAIAAYLEDYSLPLVAIARDSPRAASTPVALAEGKRYTDDIRDRFRRFLALEESLAAESARAADERAGVALAVAAGGVGASIALVLVFGFTLARAVVRPVREVAAGASRIAAGDLSARLEESGPGEIGELTRSFNQMAHALETSRAELERQNELLRQSEQLKSELVSIVSHEVRTPLTSVLGFTALLLKRDVDAETRRRYLGIIDAQGRRLSSLLDSFLEVQRVEAGQLALRRELVDLAAVIREQAQLFRAESEKHHVEVDVRARALPVVGDGDRLAQVLGNLLSNAIKYSPGGGVVRVVAERDAGDVRVIVRDEGIGIAPAQQGRIFTKFFRGDAAASGIPGSGLGLAFARAVVEAHGGRITFTSAAGAGSTFCLELPSAQIAGGGAATTERRQ